MSDLDWLSRDTSSIEKRQKKIVWFYKDRSEASKRLQEELDRRGIPYITQGQDPYADHKYPAIRIGRKFLVGTAEIKIYFLNALDRGVTLEALKNRY